jgi:hypothetical protein
MNPIDTVLGSLQGVKKVGDTAWSAKCPCRNDDDNPSLSIGIGKDNRVLLNCHRGNGGCDTNQICDSIGLTMTDLYEKKNEPRETLTLTNTYLYTDEQGEVLFRKLRFKDSAGKKTFRQQHPEAGEWVSGRAGADPVLYRLPAVKQAISDRADIWVCEGEKDVDAVTEAGRCGTTMPDGAGKWKPIHTAEIAGARRVVIVADNDPIGTEHAWAVHDAIVGAVEKVIVVSAPQGKDAYDFIHVYRGDLADMAPLARPGETQIEIPTGTDEFSEIARGIADLVNSEAPLTSKLMRARNLIDRAEVDGIQQGGRLVAWTDFVTEVEDDKYDWVIPGVLERQERVIVVAAEGVGKTTLARQIAICTAAGIQPFTRSGMAPIKTLFVDLENPERIIRRMSRQIVAAAEHYRPHKGAPINAHLLMKPDGMNLLEAADRILLEETIERTQPDLLVLGPLYKSFIDPGGKTSESVAVAVAKYLDYIRWTYDCALWLEHHAPLGGSGGRDMRPFGSAVWSRWPEFGLTIEPDLSSAEVNHFKIGTFRGSRDVRHWPTKMRWGSTLPFEALEYSTAPNN